ncbi:inositol-3-phosphate synthase [Micromonospora sp. WMMD980]|uniref:inositol-3-phosphate synthase n=1 Tax=Micromonospora sp. WMMD980 TaxID=3016088 RepID=UPI002416102B|nr:inositol-3-phosphate synthase [Micromonospora sp. WMMD980]MDG4801031.1 inositol-3-phosphate synthase [Micromonospora sp. WMMD980]
MIESVKVAVVGVGNNTSALVQGIDLHRRTGSLTGVRHSEVAGLGVDAVEVVAAFATSPVRVGRDLHEAIFLPPNNFPRLGADLAPSGVLVQRGLVDSTEVHRVADALTGAEVLLYSAPSGRPDTARAYAEAALLAGVGFVNTTSDPIARDPALLGRFTEAGLPLIGDDLASQFGTSVVHHALLRLLAERGLTLTSSYQVNLGGTEDFRNLAEHPDTKHRSKLNALGSDRVHLAPLGYLPHLGSRKVAHVNIEAQGGGGTAVSLDLRLTVHDPSGAAGVNIDLVRMAAVALRAGRGGHLPEAESLLKSPPGPAV